MSEDEEPTLGQAITEEVGDELIPVVKPEIDGLIAGVLFVIFAPIGFAIMAGMVFPYLAMAHLLGDPDGPIGVVLFLVFFVGSLVVMFFAFRALFRLGERLFRPAPPRDPSLVAQAPLDGLPYGLAAPELGRPDPEPGALDEAPGDFDHWRI